MPARGLFASFTSGGERNTIFLGFWVGADGPKFVEELLVRGARTVSRVRRSRGSERIPSVLGIVRVHRGNDLHQIVPGLRFPGLVLDALKGGKRQAHEDGDDHDDDEELDQGEGGQRLERTSW